jgi:hypothetical protein
VRETATTTATRKSWYIYTWNNLHLFPLIFLLDAQNISLAMQQADLGVEVTDLTAWQRMKMKKPDLQQPQPSLPEYYGSAESDLRTYVETVQSLHPEVDDPLVEETDEASLILSGGGMPHGRLRVLSAVTRPTTSLTRLRATLPAGSIPPRRQPRRSTSIDVSLSHFHTLSYIPSCMAKLTSKFIF